MFIFLLLKAKTCRILKRSHSMNHTYILSHLFWYKWNQICKFGWDVFSVYIITFVRSYRSTWNTCLSNLNKRSSILILIHILSSDPSSQKSRFVAVISYLHVQPSKIVSCSFYKTTEFSHILFLTSFAS